MEWILYKTVIRYNTVSNIDLYSPHTNVDPCVHTYLCTLYTLSIIPSIYSLIYITLSIYKH